MGEEYSGSSLLCPIFLIYSGRLFQYDATYWFPSCMISAGKEPVYGSLSPAFQVCIWDEPVNHFLSLMKSSPKNFHHLSGMKALLLLGLSLLVVASPLGVGGTMKKRHHLDGSCGSRNLSSCTQGMPIPVGYEQLTVSSRWDGNIIPTMLNHYQHLAILFICSCSLRKSGKGFSC